MSIEVRCPSGHKLVIATKRAGTTVRCPACKKPVEVPSLDRIAATQASKSALLKRQKQAQQPRSATQPEPPPVPPPQAPQATTPTATDQPAQQQDSPEESSQSKPLPQSTAAAGRLANEPGYRPEPTRRNTVYALAGSMFALALFSAAPAGPHWRLATAPGWAQFIVLLAVLQMAYAVWMALAPDWSSVWVAMFALAGAAAIYATGLAISLNVQPDKEAVLGLSSLVRLHGNKPTLWCLVIVLLTSLLAYLCGMVSHRWHKAYRLYVGNPSRRVV